MIASRSLVPALVVRDGEEAIARMNGTCFGLLTSSSMRDEALAERLDLD